MAFALTPPLKKSSRPDHRTYRDPNGGDWISCRLIDDNELATRAAQSGQIEIRQALGTGWVPNTAIDRLRREMRRQIVDTRARIRIRYGRNVLAGVTHRMTEGTRQQVLVLVLARTFVRSCDWQLGADTSHGSLEARAFRQPSSLTS